MRVALVTNELLGRGARSPNGFAARYLYLARLLADAGHDLLVVSFGPRRPDAGRPDLLDDARGVTYRAIETRPSTTSPLDRVTRPVRKAVFGLGVASMAQRWEREVIESIRTFSPDVVLVASPFRPTSGALVPARIPFALFLEEGLPDAANAGLVRRIQRRLLRRRPDVVVAISAAELPSVIAAGGGARGMVIPQSVDIEHWADPTVAPATDAPQVFAVGDFAQARNHDALVHIVDALERRRHGGTLPDIAVASAHPVPDEVQRRLAGRVRLLGAVDDVRPFYRGATVALVPAFEVTGVKNQILQAWAAGCPVVTTTAGASSVDGRAGVDLLVGADPDEVAARLDELAEHPDRTAALTTAGRANVDVNFSLTTVADAADDVLRALRR